MSFFGFDDRQADIDREKRAFAAGAGSSEDIAVYNWGGDEYDGLGDALQEGGDELNDETFGAVGSVGKDFDFGHQEQHIAQQPQQGRTESPQISQPQSNTNERGRDLWSDKSPFSVLPRMNSGLGRQRMESPVSRMPEDPVYQTFQSSRGGRESQEDMYTAAQRQNQMNMQQSRRQEQLMAEQLAEQRRQQQELEIQHQQALYDQETQMHLLRMQQLEQQQQQRLQQEQQQQQQMLQYAHRGTPPPRMLPTSQSPRFLEHQQRQILLLQQQQEQQQNLRLQELQEQLRMEDLERQLRGQHLSPAGRQEYGHVRQPSADSLLRGRSHSPAQYGSDGQYINPNNPQLQQRLLAQLAQAEFMREMQGMSEADQEALRVEAMRKIVETEKMEERRRRKAAKIAHMARYNDLMTQSDKDFITRIQVSQLVSADPYADDFYAQVYGAIMRSKLGLQSDDERVLKFGASGGVALGVSQKGGNRRPNAMQRMEQQVERIVSNAKRREEEKHLHSVHSLQGALGRTSGRSYKAAPRQLLHVDGNSASSASPTLSAAQAQGGDALSAAEHAAKLGQEALGTAVNTDDSIEKEPMTRREVLINLENLYETVLQIEQMRRNQPPEEESDLAEEWNTSFNGLINKMWDDMHVMDPLATSVPHPFISLLQASKGKRVLPRLTRHLSPKMCMTMLTLLVACFRQLDVVAGASVLDTIVETEESAEMEHQTQGFLASVIQSILPTVVKAEMGVVSGLIGLLFHMNDIALVVKSRPGIALLTLFFMRTEGLRHDIDSDPNTSASQQQKWEHDFHNFFQQLAPHFLTMFPSTRMAQQIMGGVNAPSYLDTLDQPVWQLLATIAVQANAEQHQTLVTLLREKILENVVSANAAWTPEDIRQLKLANINIFLHALGLDSSQISL